MRANRYEISNFSCPECGANMPIPRAKSMRREKKHIKDLYCYKCMKKVKMVEYRPHDYFKTMAGLSIANY